MSGYPTLEAWPSAVPATPLMGEFDETLSDQTLRSSGFDIGPQSARRRSAMTLTNIAVTFGMTRMQANYFMTFYESTLAFGAKSFAWTHPRTGETIAARFASPPQFKTRQYNWYEVQTEFEIIPYIAP